MPSHARIVQRIEDAQTRTSLCHSCGQPTRIVERQRSLWLICSSRDPVPSGVIGTLRRLIPHHEELVVEYAEHDQVVQARRSRLRLV